MSSRNAVAAIILLFLCSAPAAATCSVDTAWRVSFAELPGETDRKEESILVKFVRQMAEIAGVDLIYETAPFARSLVNVATGKADMHIPFLQPGDDHVIDDSLRYSDAILFDVGFSLFEKLESDLSKSDLASGNFKLETDAAHTHFFPFPIKGSACMECSLRKVELGRIDGYIYSDHTTAKTVKNIGLENKLKAVPYKNYPAKIVLPRTDCGNLFNKKLNTIVYQARIKSTHPAFRLKEDTASN